MLLDAVGPLDADTTAVVARHWQHLNTPEAAPVTAEDREAYSAQTIDGTWDLRATLDPEGGDRRPGAVALHHLARVAAQRGDPVASDLTPDTLRRLCCDADIRRIITGPAGEILDVGRSARTATPAQRRALVVRDRGCVFPGCDRPPGYCQAHHLQPWEANGPTDLENLVLAPPCRLCPHPGPRCSADGRRVWCGGPDRAPAGAAHRVGRRGRGQRDASCSSWCRAASTASSAAMQSRANGASSWATPRGGGSVSAV